MKKLIVTEAQYKMLQKEGLEYTPEKIDQFVIQAKADLAKAKELIKGYYHSIASLTVGEIVDEIEKYEAHLKKLDEIQEHYDKVYTKYYDIVEMYDFLNYPANVKELDKISNAISNSQNDLYRLHNSFEELIEAAKDLKKIDIEPEDVNEQLLKGLKDKVNNLKDKITNAVKPSKEVTVPGHKPNEGRDLDQLKAEWSKTNADTSNLRGYGEGMSIDLNTSSRLADLNARRAIMAKLKVNEATFGVTIIDQATFQIENGAYVSLVILEPNNIKK